MGGTLEDFEKGDAEAWRRTALLSGRSQAFREPVSLCKTMAKSSRFADFSGVNQSVIEKADQSFERSLHYRELELGEHKLSRKRSKAMQKVSPLNVREDMLMKIHK